MDNNVKTMEKRYGLPTAIAMVVGIVIGSGIFIKGGKVLSSVNGNIWLAILVVGIVGTICIICSLVFAELSASFGKVNGVVDYAELALGKKYAYYVGWFLNSIYFPSLAVILSFFAAVFTCQLFGSPAINFETGSISITSIGLGAGFLMIAYGINALAPKLAGKLQVSMTIIKLIPLVIMGVFGTIIGLIKGTTTDFIQSAVILGSNNVGGKGVFTAVVAFAFAFEGWIIATTIHGEIKNAKKNMPIALILGALVCAFVYALFIFSMSSVGNAQTVIGTWPLGESLPKIAFGKVFGNLSGILVYVFIIVACLGTLNGLVMGSCRGMYACSIRGMGPRPLFFSDIDKDNGFVIKSSLIGLMFSGFWYAWTVIMWMQGPDFLGGVHNSLWLGWEADEISIVTLYAFYIPMFIALIIKCKNASVLKRFIIPILGIICCIFMLFCCIYSKGYKQITGYLIFFLVFMVIGYFIDKVKNKKEKAQNL